MGFEYCSPKNIKELCGLLDDIENKTEILAGGTDLIVDIRNRIKNPDKVIDIKKISELDKLSYSKKTGLYIGANVTCNQLINYRTAKQKYELLVECAENLASYPLRNRATIIGNICNASPCSDMAPGLLCLDASVILCSSEGERVLKLSDFFKSVKQTQLKKNEFVKAVIVPAETANAKSGYLKHKRIKGHDLSVLSVAMAKHNKIYVGIASAYITPVGISFPKSASLKKIVKDSLAAVKPITDIRSSKEYRLHLIEVFINRLYKKIK